MKKILPFLVVGILVLSGLGAVSGTEGEKKELISEQMVFSQPIIVEKESFVSIDITEANSNYWDAGKPLLPSVSKVFTFPFGTIIDNVEVTFSNPVTQELSKLIEPAPEKQIVSTINVQNSVKTFEEISYEGLGIYPSERYSYKASAGIKDNERVIFCAVNLNPVQFNSEDNTILYSTRADIEIEYTTPANPIIFQDEYDLLIITPSQFESTLQKFVNHKNGRGIDTKLVTLDEIPSSGGADEQEDIKLYIKDAIENWGIEYLILVGAGVEDNELFPVRYAWMPSGQHEQKFPSDLYYADIYNATGGFSDWDANGNGKYAEYPWDKTHVDAIPDVYLGKIPCNNVNELNTYIDKAIYYDEHNKMTGKIVQIGGDTFHDDQQGVFEGEYANTVVLSKLSGYVSTKLWGSLGNLKKSNIASGYNNWPDFVDFSGHGSTSSFATHPPFGPENVWIPPEEGLSRWTGWLNFDFDLFLVRNPKKYAIVFHNACSNNKYSNSTYGANCLSWKTLKKPNGGGVIAFGASGIAYGAHGTQETERLFGWMEVHTFEELVTTKILGQVWANSVTDYYNTFSGDLKDGDYKTMLEYSMFGDPTLAAQDGDEPAPRPKPVFNVLEKFMTNFPILARVLEKILAKI
ncbi:MAG: hypothetical protein KAW45_05125 [Thermoplasmatales archaeon]|nr:hypothetical protein [Thermoplasmatales archaeon]